MLLELTEALRCPRDHDEAYVVCVPIESDGSDVRRGVIGCPVCRAEFPIVAGEVDFTERRGTGGQGDGGTETAAASVVSVPLSPRHPVPPPYDASALAAFLALEGRGGYLALVGRTARHAAALAASLAGVHVVAVNPPPGVAAVGAVSVLRAGGGSLPLRTRSMRAVALGADAAGASWIAEAVRVLLPGLRLVVEDEAAQPDGVTTLGRAGGVLVGEKRAR